MVALESLAAGVACVSTPLPAMQELLGPEAQDWTARDDSAQALAEVVERTLRTPAMDRCRRAHARALAHDPARFAQQWQGLLQCLVSEFRPGGP